MAEKKQQQRYSHQLANPADRECSPCRQDCTGCASERADWMTERAPRCEKLDGSTLKIVPSYTEAGYYTEAHCVTIEDSEGRKAVYTLHRIVEPKEELATA